MSMSDIWQKLAISYDEETQQWYVSNDNTPWVFWLWETKQDALKQYLEVLKESVMVDFTNLFLQSNEKSFKKEVHTIDR